MRISFSFLALFLSTLSWHILSAQSPVASDYFIEARDGVTPGYYLGFKSLADELRIYGRPPLDRSRSNLLQSFYLDFHYSAQEFNPQFFENSISYDQNRSNNSSFDTSKYMPNEIKHDQYGIILGLSLGNNPNLDIKVPLSVSRFEIDDVDDTGFVGGVELFPNYRVNEYIAWGVNLSYLNSNSDFPVFDESMTSVSFEGIAESSPAYGMNWSARLSIGNYFPSEEDAFWLYKGSLALHFALSENFTFLPFFGLNYSPSDMIVNGTLWADYGFELAFNPKGSWGFNLGVSGMGGHDVIDYGMEFYASTKANF